MTLAQREKELQHQIRVRKRLRDKHHRLHQGRRAQREAHAIKSLRRKLSRVRELRALPRVQYDSVSVGYIPHDAPAAAYYVNGLYTNEAAVKAQAPHAKYTSISVSSDTLADALDVEVGDATVADCPGWFHRFKDARPNRKPIFYCSASVANELVSHLRTYGIERDEYLLWTAHYIGKHICGRDCEYAKAAGRADATQYTTTDERVDVSQCLASYWLRRV